MSNTARIAATAANTLTKPLNVEEVFSTYLYKGTDANNITATTGIDMSGEGGMVWFKGRSAIEEGTIVDSARGVDYAHYTPTTAAHFSISGLGFSAPTFTSTGFTVGDMPVVNRNTTDDYVAWSFRKAPKFFDVVTYTGNGVAGRTISHNLGTTVGCIIVKRTSSAQNWAVYHRGNTAAPETDVLYLNLTDATTDLGSAWYDTAPTSTEFTLGDQIGVNANGETYVAYLFAHNNGDGGFGPTGDQDIIKCGSYTGNGSSTGPEIDLGFEPQWLLFKDITNANDWIIIDNMRGMVVDNDLANADAYLRPNLSNQEGASTFVEPTPTGFKVQNNGWTNVSGANIIYIAIRRGPMAVPESATDVFDIATRDGTEPGFDSSFPVDFALTRTVNTADNWWAASRLNQGKYLQTNGTNAEASASSLQFDYMDGWNANAGVSSTLYSWMWKRAPNYFDAVAYTGNSNGSTPTQTLTHNLGVKPEMMWVKSRGSSQNWYVFHKDVWDATNNYYLRLNSTAQASASDGSIFPSDVTDTQFTVSERWEVNQSGVAYIAYLFASLDGVSKVGSFTYTQGVAQNIDCGFSSGARFVLYKRTSGTSGWTVFDTARGIVAGNDPMLFLNSTAAETSSYDFIDPYSGGFALSDSTANLSGDYIFYAIA